MESKLREIFLDQVEAALSEDPCDESLFSLFKITSPTLKRSSLDSDHEQHFKKLRAEIHPSNHRNSNRANRLFQSLSKFYEKSLDETKSSPARKRKRTSHFPLNFSSSEKWTYMTDTRVKSIPKEKKVGSLVAFQCINARGSIAHGKKTSYHYFTRGDKDQSTTKQLFEACGGYKVLSTTDEIKEELMTRGPVVSSSFLLSEAFLSSAKDRNRFFDVNLKNKVHEVLITGWEHTPMGEVWHVRPLAGQSLGVKEESFNVAFGQYDIDRMCVAPKGTFENWNWECGPYFRFDVGKVRDTWYSWRGVNFSLDSEQLEELSEVVGGDLFAAITSKKKFTLQDSRKKAHSRSCFLTKVIHEKNKSKCWRISATFV